MKESISTAEHKSTAPRAVVYGVIVISTSSAAGARADRSGPLIETMIRDAGASCGGITVVPDEPERIKQAVAKAIVDGCEVIIATGGTGLTRGDVSVETLRALFVKEIPGFQHLFMQLSYDEIGPACMLSRAAAGVLTGGIILFSVPGSPAACELAMRKIILPEAAHMLKHTRE